MRSTLVFPVLWRNVTEEFSRLQTDIEKLVQKRNKGRAGELERHCPVYVPDMPGFGRYPMPSPMSLDQLDAFLEQQGNQYSVQWAEDEPQAG